MNVFLPIRTRRQDGPGWHVCGRAETTRPKAILTTKVSRTIAGRSGESDDTWTTVMVPVDALQALEALRGWKRFIAAYRFALEVMRSGYPVILK